MKEKFPEIVENCRKRIAGRWSSEYGDKGGYFIVPYPYNPNLKKQRNDVTLSVLVGSGDGWDHISIHVELNGEKKRCPTWEEMSFIKDLFFEDNEWTVQYHPAKSNHINLHPYVLHIWKPIDKELPVPPEWMV